MERVKKGVIRTFFVWAAVLLLSLGSAISYGANVAHAETTVYITRTGSKYHTHKCGNGTYYPATLSEALARGLTPCSKCFGSSAYIPDFGSGSTGTAAVQPVKINKTSLLLVKGQKANLKISNAAQKVSWSSSKKSVAAVSANGKVTAKKKGKAVITAKVGSDTKKCKVTVEAPALNVTSVTLNLSETKTLKLSGCKHSVTWRTSNSSVVKVSKGKLTAKGVGTAKVTAAVHGKKYVCRVTVRKPEVQQIILEKNSVQMGYGKDEVIGVRTIPANAMDYYEVSVRSSNPALADVWFDSYDSTISLESFYKSGNAEISVSIGNRTARCRVEIIPGVIQSLALEETTLILKPDESQSISYEVTPYDAADYYKAEWTSANASVASVTGDGGGYSHYATVQAVGEGETDIKLTLGGKNAVCHVIVAKPEIRALNLDTNEITLYLNESCSIYFDVTPYDAVDYYESVWASADESVAAVTRDGGSYSHYATIEAVGEGETDIILSLGGKEAVCHVSVGARRNYE